MATESTSLLLSDLSWPDVREELERDQRLIVPVGACDQFGPHLPIGAATLVVECFARDLSRDFRVLRAPAVPYGVNVPGEKPYPGSATLREKTLHALLNDLLANWEDQGFREFILLTVHDYDSHVEAIATVTGTNSRVRVIEVLNINLSEMLAAQPGPQHGGEILTSLMLHLHPELVRMDRALDHLPDDTTVSTLRRTTTIPGESPGSIGQPTLATAEKGRRLYEYIREKIRSRVFDAD
jgi:creatinine amidohydrolase